MIRNSLFLKIYATLLAALAIVAFSSAVFWWVGQSREEEGWRGRRDRFIAAMLPPADGAAQLRPTLERLGRAFDAEIAVYAPDGRLIAANDRDFPQRLRRREWEDGSGGPMRRARGMHAMLVPLDDGRSVAVRMTGADGPGGGLAYLAMIAAVTGLASYPVVRHLTRRLETLRRGVDAWGEGALVTRVPANGSDEVAAVAKSFNRAADHIERMIVAHRTLLANASHELRSPLARLRMAIDLYEINPGHARKDEIVRNLGELDDLVEEILLASRLDHAHGLDRTEPVDLLALASEEGARNGIQVSGVPAIVDGDPKLLTRLVRNLMQNALRHGAPPVEVEVARAGPSVTLSVRDHGAGIPEAEGDRVFEAFYRPSGRGEQAGGWGLGLSLVRQIAEHHAGAVRHETPGDGGARFVVSVPAADPASPAAAATARRRPPQA
jgi:two-component system OmpR family sensor kinase